MANFFAALVVSAFVAGSALTSVHSEQSDHTKVMRKQNDAVQLGAGGEMKIVDGPAQKSKPDQKAHESSLDAQLERANTANLETDTISDLCNINFTKGIPLTNNCTDSHHQELIEEDSLCESAALQACPDSSCIGEPFKINNSKDLWLWSKRPKRCYVIPATDTQVAMWHFNDAGGEPFNISIGTPVCVQPEFREGTQDANDCDSDTYVNIMTEKECRQAATCLSSCIHEIFAIYNESEQQKMPPGCHNSTMGCIRFNNLTGSDPTNPKGRPICVNPHHR